MLVRGGSELMSLLMEPLFMGHHVSNRKADPVRIRVSLVSWPFRIGPHHVIEYVAYELCRRDRVI